MGRMSGGCLVAAMVLLISACGGNEGLSQDEVDALIEEAVASALATTTTATTSTAVASPVTAQPEPLPTAAESVSCLDYTLAIDRALSTDFTGDQLWRDYGGDYPSPDDQGRKLSIDEAKGLGGWFRRQAYVDLYIEVQEELGSLEPPVQVGDLHREVIEQLGRLWRAEIEIMVVEQPPTIYSEPNPLYVRPFNETEIDARFDKLNEEYDELVILDEAVRTVCQSGSW